MKQLLIGLATSTLLALAACGSDTPPPPDCNGTSCACEPGAACDIEGTACEGNSCSLDCTEANECTGACGSSCSLDCSGGSSCAMTVGDSSSVSCSDGSTCVITCTGSCSVSCSDDSTCSLACGEGATPEPIVEGGSCG